MIEFVDHLALDWALLGITPVVCECVLVVVYFLIAVRARDFPAPVRKTEPRECPIRVLNVENTTEGGYLLGVRFARCWNVLVSMILLVGGV